MARAEDHDRDFDDAPALRGRIVAVGIPGASAISAVGVFLPGSPIQNKPALAAFTRPGQVLDPVRILVGSTSNFGAPLARTDHLPGSFLSIDPRGATVRVPADFALGGGQASALGGRVQLFVANNPAFLNSIQSSQAATKDFTGTSNPLGLSINWAFGRLWPANAPTGLEGAGTSTILDPQGFPLAKAPNGNFGGVYHGDQSNRGSVSGPVPVTVPAGFALSTSQIISGALETGAVGTGFLGASPDGTAKAVFAVVEADGSIVQEHTLQGLDGLSGPGAISPLIGRGFHDDDSEADDRDRDDHGVTPRLGVILNWFPSMTLFVSEPFENRIAVMDLGVDVPNGDIKQSVFKVTGVHHIRAEALNQPVDMAPAILETDDNNFSSNTTLNEGSDIYVANRGNNTIVRMRQNGTVVAVRRVTLEDGRSLGKARINGIATEYSAAEENGPPTKIWVTVTGHIPGVDNSSGAVLELPTF